MGAELRFVFRNFPGGAMHHPNAQHAAEPPKLRLHKVISGRCTTSCSSTRTSLICSSCVYTRERLDWTSSNSNPTPQTVPTNRKLRMTSGVAFAAEYAGRQPFFINGVRYDGPYDLNSMLEDVRSAST